MGAKTKSDHHLWQHMRPDLHVEAGVIGVIGCDLDDLSKVACCRRGEGQVAPMGFQCFWRLGLKRESQVRTGWPENPKGAVVSGENLDAASHWLARFNLAKVNDARAAQATARADDQPGGVTGGCGFRP